MDKKAEAPGETLEIDSVAAWAEAPDPILSSLSSAADVAGMSITVLVDGAIVEGELLPAGRFFEQEREAFSSARFNDFPEDSKSLVIELFETILTVPDESELPDEVKDLPRRFVHLSNVSITGAGFSPGVPGKKNRLRIPIEKISGWTLGRS